MKVSLGRCGYTDIEEAENGLAALNRAKGEQFDCVITDWNMPEMDGLELSKSLRKLDNYAKIPIMMVTTEGGKQDIIEALTQGVSSYIVKPFTQETLQQKMTALFEG